MNDFDKITIQLKNEKGEKELFEVSVQDLKEKKYIDAEFGTFLKRIRKDKKITQQELANLSGVAVSTITSLENGKRNITEEFMKKLIDALGMEMVYWAKDKAQK